MSRDPDWLLIRRIIRIVTAAPGGGLHRADVADLLCLSPFGEAFKTALMIAYKRGRIDFCRQFVVTANRREMT